MKQKFDGTIALVLYDEGGFGAALYLLAVLQLGVDLLTGFGKSLKYENIQIKKNME